MIDLDIKNEFEFQIKFNNEIKTIRIDLENPKFLENIDKMANIAREMSKYYNSEIETKELSRKKAEICGQFTEYFNEICPDFKELLNGQCLNNLTAWLAILNEVQKHSKDITGLFSMLKDIQKEDSTSLNG